MTLTIKELTVDEELGAFITSELESGHFASESEMVEAALREMMTNAGAERLWRRIEESERQVARGETIPADEVFKRLRERVRQAASQSG
jgi:Arc/MetJ-type ribon-helix-helix transcriptional regulator